MQAIGARLGVVVLALLSQASGCVTLKPHHEHEIAEAWREGPQARIVLLAPMNATTGIDDELQPGADATFVLVRERLEENGIAVREIDSLYLFREAWRNSFQGVKLDPREGGDDIPPAAISRLFAELRREQDFDALVMPDLAIRPARINGSTARWDGVTRMLVDERFRVPWRGNVPAISLRIRVYAEDGERVFDSVGGLDMVFAVTNSERMTLIDEPLSDLENLRQGVRTAFDPLLPLDE